MHVHIYMQYLKIRYACMHKLNQYTSMLQKLTTATELYTRLQTTANKSATLAMLTASLYCQQTQSENSENNFSSYTIY